MNKRFLISGFVGADNIGDELILDSIKNIIKSAEKDAVFTVLSIDPKTTKELHGVNSIYWPGLSLNMKRLIAVFKGISEADYVIIGGGGLLQDVHWVGTIPRYLSIALFAKILKKPVIYFSLGVGPIKRRLLKYLTRIISNDVDIIFVRDMKSKEYLEEIGVKKTQITVTGDPVIMHSDFYKNENKNENKNDNKRVGVSIRELNIDSNFKTELSKALDNIVANHGYDVFLIPMEPKTDIKLCREISSMMKEEVTIYSNDAVKPIDVVNQIKEMNYIISMRLHGLIVGSSYGIPGIGLVYDPKVRSFLNQNGLSEYALSLENFQSKTLITTFSHLLNNEDEYRNKLISNLKLSKNKILIGTENLLNTKHISSKYQGIKNVYKMFMLFLPQGINKVKNFKR
ncbi:polysaccharide pyruvyl transferase family protein [Thalassobacillus devorans]|uniref:polysaccharide pyruvyl transferase family protein n=1 Tax=Thalassobacillus devorans TaxID=279813 RepID=UPI000A1CA396|nr:polysaccharide pyruvyl transferase family protein [Thalassobacillus devorans]